MPSIWSALRLSTDRAAENSWCQALPNGRSAAIWEHAWKPRPYYDRKSGKKKEKEKKIREEEEEEKKNHVPIEHGNSIVTPFPTRHSWGWHEGERDLTKVMERR